MKARNLYLASTLAGVALIGCASWSTAQGTSNNVHKLTVDNRDGDSLTLLTNRGATVLADYRAFSLWQATSQQSTDLVNRATVELRDDFDRINFRGGVQITTDGGEPPIPAGLRQSRVSGFQFWMVHFVGPIKDAWLSSVVASNLQIVGYAPANAYVLWGDGAGLSRLDSLTNQSPFIQNTYPFHPYYRLEPSLQQKAAQFPSNQFVDVTIQIYTTPGLDQTLALIRAQAGQVYLEAESDPTFTGLSLQIRAGQLIPLANRADIINFEPWGTPTKLDEVQSHIVAGKLTTDMGGNVVPVPTSALTYVPYQYWLLAKGFPSTPSSYPVVDIVDDGLDQGDASAVLHPDFHEFGGGAQPDRVAYIASLITGDPGKGVGGHGNLNAGIVGGYNTGAGAPYVDANGFRIGLGVSPFGRVAATKLLTDSGAFAFLAVNSNNFANLLHSIVTNGGNLTSDSWGYKEQNMPSSYNHIAHLYDWRTRDASSFSPGNQEMLHVFAAGNSGPAAYTILSPATAKNVLTVGATENVRDDGVFDACSTPQKDANNADDITPFSSRGPIPDGHVKPDLVAPGTHVQGPASQDPGFTGFGVCGAFGNDGQFPAADAMYPTGGQTLYTWSSGTSHSAPAVAGAASLVYEHYHRVLSPGQTPSPAMTKALLINSARYLTGLSAADTLPSNSQGWGGVDLGRNFDGTPRMLLDQAVVFGGTGESYTTNGTVFDATQPFRVTLVWSDAPGNPWNYPYVNDLNLEVTVGGQTYKGNVFITASSVNGGTNDIKNNVECVFKPAGVTGPFTVTVTAANIAGDGLPNNADSTDQDFALVIYNGVQSPAPAADVYMQDQLSDTGSEPTAGPVFFSPDIWVRHAAAVDPTQTHENPEFSQVNYVNVKLRNSGPKASPPLPAAGILKLYWAFASTGIAWPKPWNWFADIPASVGAGLDIITNAPWVPPATGDLCLLAIWVCSQDPLNGPLTSDVYTNTTQNNNIALRNVNVVNTLPNVLTVSKFIFRNTSPAADTLDVRIRAVPSDRHPPDTFLDHGEIFFDLGPRLFENWQRAGGVGSGFELITNELGRVTLKLLNQNFTSIRSIPMDGAQEEQVAISFRARDQEVRDFSVEVTQLHTNTVPVGGIGYNLRMRLTNAPPLVSITSPTNGARFPVGRPIVVGAYASDPDGTITNVEFFADSSKIGEASLRPFSVTWSNAPVGSHVLAVVASDNYGTNATSPSVGITVFVPPVLRVIFSNSALVISWDDPNATLEEADDVTGPWTPLPGAQSPHTIQPVAARKFYRLATF